MPGEATIKTGTSVYQPYTFLPTPDGKLIGVNGLDRGFIWDGMTATAWDLGVDAPASAPSLAAAATGGCEAGVYTCYVRFKTTDGYYGNLSAAATVTTTAGQRINWSSIPTSSNTRITHVELYRSLVGTTAVVYLVTTLAIGTTTYADTTTDATLGAASSLPITHPNGEANANQFTVPPNDRAVALMFNDRALYLVGVVYDEGTVAVTNGSAAVTGTGTSWTTAMAGRYLYRTGDTRGYLISSVASATSLTLAENYAGVNGSGASYAIKLDPAKRVQLMFSSVWDAEEKTGPEAVHGGNVISVLENYPEPDELTGAFVLNGHCFVGLERHLFQLDFVRQPLIDTSVYLFADRGLLNQRCWCIADDVAYVLDRRGAYSISGGQLKPLSDPIHDLFDGSTLDWSKSKWWHAQAWPMRHCVAFFVTFTGDTETRPMRALVYNYLLDAWWVEQYQWGLGGGCATVISGRERYLLGGEDDLVYLLHQGTLDGLDSTQETGTVRGTASASTSTTLTDATATFPSGVATSLTPIVIYAGTGKGQVRRVTTRNSDTQLTISSAWTTNPDTTSKYQLGGVEWNARFCLLALPESRDWTEPKQAVQVTFAPTDNPSQLDVRKYFNHDTSPANNRLTRDTGGVVSYKQADPDAVVNLHRTQDVLANVTGLAVDNFSGMRTENADGPTWASVEFRGFQGVSPITIYDIALEGVARG